LLQDVVVADSGSSTSQGGGPVDFVFYVDEKCEHVAEILVHAWLNLHECSIEACLVGELLVGKALQNHASVPGRLHQEVEETKPVDLLQVGVTALLLAQFGYIRVKGSSANFLMTLSDFQSCLQLQYCGCMSLHASSCAGSELWCTRLHAPRLCRMACLHYPPLCHLHYKL